MKRIEHLSYFSISDLPICSLALRVAKRFQGNSNDFHLEGSGSHTVNIPSTNFEKSG